MILLLHLVGGLYTLLVLRSVVFFACRGFAPLRR
jgi:hypothetical protein